ncbi:carbohydrate esterase family 4 protein [Elsinoe ampelina]|uniref:Carbohydrate esterase family 4 protein n=1 Tax=Elsinoe ampelina TaxID=302913 RepID=A0A6A6FYF4_9PEZI|nr:carbohydrate esterase family 4 protein [Elsinoe ampelina]
MPHSIPPRPPWPNSSPAALSITMDNMAEAADLHRGLHDPSTPLGQHHSTTTQLPRMLDLLRSRGIHATYFVEGWNNAHYPEVIKKVLADGHEVGFHAWQHEVWKLLDGETEVENLDKAIGDLKTHVGATYKGFRPPGGLVTERTLGLMKERGFTYLSPAAERCAVVDGVAMVPFRWPEIDAYFYMENTGVLRKGKGDAEAVMTPVQMKERLIARIERLMEEGGYVALLFHPFLTDNEEKHQVMKEVVDFVKEKEKEGLWVAPCREVADWVLKNEVAFGNDPGWDTAEWKKK